MYDLYVLESSPYCTKTRAMLAYKGVPFRTISETLWSRYSVLRRRTGRTIVPVLATKAFALADSTRIAHYLEEEHPTPSLHPDDPRRAALGRLVEQLADEWLTRLVLLLRWTDAAASRDHARRIAGELVGAYRLARRPVAGVLPVILWPAMRRRGVRPVNRATLLSSFRAFVALAQELLAQSTFFFGPRPTLADFALYGPLWQMRADAVGRVLLPRPETPLSRWLRDMDAVGAGLPVFSPEATAPLARYAPLLRLYSETWLRLGIASAEARRTHAHEIEVRTGHGPYRARASDDAEGCLKDDLAAIEGALTRAGGLLDDPAEEAPLWIELTRLAGGPAREVLRPFPRLWARLAAR